MFQYFRSSCKVALQHRNSTDKNRGGQAPLPLILTQSLQQELARHKPCICFASSADIKGRTKKDSSLTLCRYRPHILSPKWLFVHLAIKLTCSAWSSARWHSTTAKASVLFCCTPTFTASRLFMLSSVWACWSAMVLEQERHLLAFTQQTLFFKVHVMTVVYRKVFFVLRGFGGEWEPLKQLLPGNSGLCKHIKYCILKAALGQSTVMLKTGTQEWLRHYLPPLNGDSISSPEWLLSEQENGSNCIQPVPNHSLIALF